MKQKFYIYLFFLFFSVKLSAQFPPAAGQEGSTAIASDSSIFIAWATKCEIKRGFKDISKPDSGLVTVGDKFSALGVAGGNGVVSMGDGGEAILTFDKPIKNGEGWDFAVFENSFSDTYLELAFVEVSTDGFNFIRFPASSFTSTDVQCGSFGELDPTKLDQLAGKYRGLFGTPFDLEVLKNISTLDISAISHVKIIDVVGCLQDNYYQVDQFGNKINDPWPTPYPSGGFDLDAIGVIHQATLNVFESKKKSILKAYPNPAFDHLNIEISKPGNGSIAILDLNGRKKHFENFDQKYYPLTLNINLANITHGIYFIVVYNDENQIIESKIMAHE